MIQQNDQPPEDLITPKEAARIVKRHISSVHRWIQTGKLRAWQIVGERYMVSEADIRGMVRRYVPPVLPTPKHEVNREHLAAVAYFESLKEAKEARRAARRKKPQTDNPPKE